LCKTFRGHWFSYNKAGEHPASKKSGKIPETQNFKKSQPARVIMMTQRGNKTILRIKNSMEKIK
jgi:hypothetical protein